MTRLSSLPLDWGIAVAWAPHRLTARVGQRVRRVPTWRVSSGRGIAATTLPRMDTDQITIQLHRDAAALLRVLDHYIQLDSGTGYGGILRSLQTTIIQDGFGGVRPGPLAGLPAHEQEE